MCQRGSPGDPSSHTRGAERWQGHHCLLLLCFQPFLSTTHGATARPATENGQDLGLANSVLPPLTWSPAWGECNSFPPHSPSPQKPFMGTCCVLLGEGGHGAAVTLLSRVLPAAHSLSRRRQHGQGHQDPSISFPLWLPSLMVLARDSTLGSLITAAWVE